MPRCGTCGFGHAQPDRCINCGDPDPFRRQRIIKATLSLLALLVCAVAAVYLYHKYSHLERSAREAELAAELEKSYAPPRSP